MRKFFSFEFKLSVLAICAIALSGLTLQVYFRDYQKISHDIEKLNTIYERTALLNQMVISVQQAEFAHQKYFLEQNEEALSHFYETSFKVPLLSDKVRSAYSSLTHETRNIEVLSGLIQQDLQDMRAQVKDFNDKNLTLEQILAANEAKTGDPVSRRIMNVVNAMISNESMNLQEEQSLNSIRSELQIKLYLVGSIIVLGVIAVCMSLIIKEVRQNRKLTEQLEHNATHDFLTGLPNRSYFMGVLKHTLARARREDTLAVLFFLDLNGFKHINDTYGHEIGDLVLVRVAEKLRATMRESDILSRLGGDEFVILAPKINDKSEVDIVTGKIEAALNEMSLPFLAGAKITTSIGHALIPHEGETADVLLAHADKNMYTHKYSSKAKKADGGKLHIVKS